MSAFHDRVVRGLKPEPGAERPTTAAHAFDICELIALRCSSEHFGDETSASDLATQIAHLIREVASQWDPTREELR